LKGSDDDLLREMTGFAANRMMAMEVEELTGAGWRALPRPDEPVQRLSRADLADARRHGGPGDPETAEGELLPELPGASAGICISLARNLPRQTIGYSRSGSVFQLAFLSTLPLPQA
jgi:hypothetical protein